MEAADLLQLVVATINNVEFILVVGACTTVDGRRLEPGVTRFPVVRAGLRWIFACSC